MVQEAEQNGKLVLLAEDVKKAVWKRMDNDLQKPAIPTESVDFIWPTWLPK